MTTAEMYRLHAPGASTAMIGPNVRVLACSWDDVLIASGNTDDTASRMRAMHELAALSFEPGALDRDLEDEINRRGWGITEA